MFHKCLYNAYRDTDVIFSRLSLMNRAETQNSMSLNVIDDQRERYRLISHEKSNHMKSRDEKFKFVVENNDR